MSKNIDKAFENFKSKVFNCLRRNGECSIVEIVSLTNMHHREVALAVGGLYQEGTITKSGSFFNGRYFITPMMTRRKS